MEETERSFSFRILEAFNLDPKSARPCSFAFSTRQVPDSWKADTFDLPVPFYLVRSPGATYGEVRSLASGIKAENYVLLAEFRTHALLVLRRAKKEDNQPLLVSVKKEEDFERVANTIRKFNFKSDELIAHSALNSSVELLRVGAERYYTNRGLFSNHYLKERLSKSLSERGRNAERESEGLLSKFKGELPTTADKARDILLALGYQVATSSKTGYAQYVLLSGSTKLHATCVVASTESLDIKVGEFTAPSYQAVAALRDFNWVILTNGRLWRLYSSKVSSSSTNYFEVDLEGIVSESDPKLVYFVALFSAGSLLPRQGMTDLDLTYEGGLKYAREIEEDLRSKVFNEQLFLDLVKAVLEFSVSKSYPQQELESAKTTALKLLYRLLFILYAESRALLPVNNPKYREVSMDNLRESLSAYEKQSESSSVWDYLTRLFVTIGKGNPQRSVPEYDGALFEEDPKLDHLSPKNKFIVPALRGLTEIDGKGIDYQNLGVRHLGSLYEALLDYSIRQAKQDLVIYKDEILDATYAADQKVKPRGYIEKGELYLSIGGLARKGTGSYYTPEEIVHFLVKKGLEPHLEARTKRFTQHMEKLRKLPTRDPELEKEILDDLLGLRVLDPAMGSGHFLVTAVDEITRWIINLIKEHPDDPLERMIEDDRKEILQEQSRKGISLDRDLLTDTVILKRTVMKRCVYGVDANPLAVELAKLSLWLDSFTIGTPLTFLDHHVRCGDSLIGLWLENIEDRAFGTTLDSWTGTLTGAGTKLFEYVSTPADLTVDQVKQTKTAYEDVRMKMGPLRILLNINVAGILDSKLDKKLPRNLSLIEAYAEKREKRPDWWGLVEDALALAEKYRAFHWELEFSEAFSGPRRGFDLVITNPPWDVLKPEDDDFFSEYYVGLRRIANTAEKRKIIKSLLKSPETSELYNNYVRDIEQRVLFYKQSGEYVRRGSGDTNSWKLFLERTLKLLADSGSLALVIPSGIVTDEGAKKLRETLFQGRIVSLYEFENKKGVFPDIDSRMKFVLLVWEKAHPTQSFSAAFYLHDAGALDGKVEQDKLVEMPFELIHKCAPQSLSIPEVRNNQELHVFSKIYDSHPLLSDNRKGWAVTLVSELHRTNDSDLLRTDGRGWPFIEGKNFHQFVPYYEKPSFVIEPRTGLQRTNKHKEYRSINEEIHKRFRLVFRDVARSTDVRSSIACIIPPASFCSDTAHIVLPIVNDTLPNEETYLKLISYLAGIFNSFVFDFLIRTRISMHLNLFYVYQTPVPHELQGNLPNRIIEISAHLNSSGERFNHLCKVVGVEPRALPLRDRLKMTAELNILVAKHYGLSKKDLDVILHSFQGFKEDKDLGKLEGEIRWTDDLVRRFNGEVRKLVQQSFDSMGLK